MNTVQNKRLALICLIALTVFSVNSYSQDTSGSVEECHYWLNMGFGISTVDMSGGAGFSYQSGKKLISIRYTHNEDFTLFELPKESVWDVGVLYGIIRKSNYGLISASGGISIVGGYHRGAYIESTDSYEKKSFFTFGIPLEFQLFFTPFDYVGVGLNEFANLNPENTFVGMLLCLQIGKL
jgi:hypothetical protein